MTKILTLRSNFVYQKNKESLPKKIDFWQMKNTETNVGFIFSFNYFYKLFQISFRWLLNTVSVSQERNYKDKDFLNYTLWIHKNWIINFFLF